MKVCVRCGCLKELEDYHKKLAGHRSVCKVCVHKERGYKDWKPRRPPPSDGLRYCAHCKTMLPQERFVRTKGTRDGWAETCKTCLTNMTVAGYRANPRIRKKRLLRFQLRRILVKGIGTKKCESLTGASIEVLRAHFESLFTNEMSWENYGEWEIDHIIPCCKFDLTDPEEAKECFLWTNLRPLWKADNLAKGSK